MDPDTELSAGLQHHALGGLSFAELNKAETAIGSRLSLARMLAKLRLAEGDLALRLRERAEEIDFGPIDPRIRAWHQLSPRFSSYAVASHRLNDALGE